jgi:peroxiredoxin Q/BCP
MAQLRQDREEFEKRGVVIMAIGPEKREDFAKYWTEHDMPYIGIPDPEHRVAGLYGQEFKLLKLGRMPAQIIVDSKGVVRYAHYGTSMSDIPDDKEIFEVIDGLQDR